MKKINVLLTAVLCVFNLLGEEKIRPVKDDIGFCWKKSQISRLVKVIEQEIQVNEVKTKNKIIGGISPHDDYLYAGPTYLPLFKRIKAKEVIVFGVAHSKIRKLYPQSKNRLVLESFKYWYGLDRKKIKISPLRKKIKNELPKEKYLISNDAHSKEHSIEAMIPFLDYFNPGFVLTPIIVGPMDIENLNELADLTAKIIFDYLKTTGKKLGEDVFILISADANHYGINFNNSIFGLNEKAHASATNRDKTIINDCLKGELNNKKISDLCYRLWKQPGKDYIVWCGQYSIPFGIQTLLHINKISKSKNKIFGNLIEYSDTYSKGVLRLNKPGFGITGPFSLKHWVSFFSLYFLEK